MLNSFFSVCERCLLLDVGFWVICFLFVLCVRYNNNKKSVRLNSTSHARRRVRHCLTAVWIRRWSSSQWRHVDRRYRVKAVHTVDNSGSTSHSIISYLGPEIFVQINHILTKFCSWKLGVPVIMTHRVHGLFFARYSNHINDRCGRQAANTALQID